MNKVIAAIALVLACACTAQADRLLYTSEMIDAATIIGAWLPGDIKKEGENVVLQKPSRLFKGDPLLLQKETLYSPRLQDAIRGIAGRGSILFINVREGRADLVADLAFLPRNGITDKVISKTINQLMIRTTWNTLTVRQQIESSDIIVAGTISGLGKEVPEDTNPTVTAETIFRGMPPKAMVILPGGPLPEKGQALFLIQRYYGSGPDYMVMHFVPLDRATSYLAILGKGIPQPSSGSDSTSRSDAAKPLQASIAGSVETLPAKKPVANARVLVQGTTSNGNSWSLESTTDAEGRFFVGAVPPNSLVVVVVSKAMEGMGWFQVQAEATLMPGEKRDLGVLRGGVRPPPLATPENAHLLEPQKQEQGK